ncbi:MAG: hypothetical protein VYA32_04255 [Planctomycetota bacterium]|nr:hypothetical protein [Planctomycetota bacterium]MED5400409.1 hypothetical protein [Planctomycetota bacterium]MEE3364262.1 hypothetical protein [Planctomycetota bacterium]
MAHAYTPGLMVTPRTRHRVRRILPIPGEVKKSVGDTVAATDVVAETFMPGNVIPINVANMLSMPPGDIPDCMLKKVGDSVEVDDLLAETPGIFGFFKAVCRSQATGTIETISPVTGQVIIRGTPLPVQVTAYLSGEVVEVIPDEGVLIETETAFVQGIFGIGGETNGRVVMACDSPDQELTPDKITPDMSGAVVIGGGRMTGDAVKRAIEVGCAAIVSGGLDDADLREILGYDLGVAITGSETIGVTLVVTEGFGEIAMADRTFQLLSDRQGSEASVNGTTQIRAGVMRPEIVIPDTSGEHVQEAQGNRPIGLLEAGTSIRVIRDPYFGAIGTVVDLPSEPQELDSGSLARVLSVENAAGERLVVPRANVELIEG